MREILFRGKTPKDAPFNFGENNRWIAGGFFKDCYGETYIARTISAGAFFLRQVLPETVGEYTGMKDKNGKRIFEGDIVSDGGIISSGLIAFHQDCTAFYCDFQQMSYSMASSKYWEVVGNIHDNPELLEGGAA
jgi:hypothetical protein